ncbi:PH domain-containing protein [Micromonospora sp. ANENR4]|uniref:PH domain-containing protein n=1 Tax=Micromonospora sp. ANENR4 TaxID=2783662 RepID=UPI00188FBD42|nr:PH domain-containing protein [Micromonospora sp. ANENR4]
MVSQVFVDDIGINLVYTAGTVLYRWPEIANVSVQAWLLPPENQRFVELDITHVCGEFVTTNERFEGFYEAVAAVAAQAGAPLPDLSTLDPSDGVVQVYP